MKNLTNKQRCYILIPIFVVTIIVLTYLSMNIGYISISVSEVFQTLIGNGTRENEITLWTLRLPKTAVAIISGMCLAVAGAVMQGVTRNPLATPSMIGVNSGASLAILLVVYASDKGLGMPVPLPLAAVLGGLVTFTIVYGLALRYSLSPVKLILNGIAINSCIGAISLVLSMKLSADAYTWRSLIMAGSLSYATWDMILVALIVSVPLIGFVVYKAFHLNILNLNEEMAIGLGLNLKKERKNLLYVTVILSSVVAYIAGGIGFIGMIAPHIAKRIVGSNYKLFLPLAAFIGMNMILVADLIARLLSNIEADVPIGTLLSLIGAPYLLYLLFAEDR